MNVRNIIGGSCKYLTDEEYKVLEENCLAYKDLIPVCRYLVYKKHPKFAVEALRHAVIDYLKHGMSATDVIRMRQFADTGIDSGPVLMCHQDDKHRWHNRVNEGK